MEFAYSMTVIDGVFCAGHACDKQTRDVSTVMLEWSEIMCGYNTSDTTVREKDKVGRKIANENEKKAMRKYTPLFIVLTSQVY